MQLPRKVIIMDDRGRLTVPEYMRKKLNLGPGQCALTIELYPNEKPKGLVIKKS